ncbi:MAG: glycosyltransferase family 2 protein [Methanothrix sp.]|jgi:GT2 family glycosyltransferase|uniref:glycosyltransferase family 2 protein n=1 Tax=Methanothrix sp. TaxID=90426 RepID=UPI00247B4827|nr:glycosyltransferase family 2 protein [Methanothrix sp.]
MIPSLDIIIVNWNSGKQLHQCIESIMGASKDGFRLSNVCIVDNGSHDGSMNGIGNFDLPIRIIRNEDNKGFATACNQGARSSQSDYLLFLNPDVKLLEGSLIKPLDFMERLDSQMVGIVGIQLLNESGDVARTCARFPTPASFCFLSLGLSKLFPKMFPDHFMKEWDHKESREVDQVMGAFLLIRRSLFQRLGGFDERFFVYYEDLDLSYRAWKSGWKSLYLADAQAYHKGGGTSRQVKDRRLFYSLRSRILYSYKHFGWGSATVVTLMTLLVEPFTRLVWAVARLSVTEMANTLKGYILLWREAPKIFKYVWGLGKYEGAPAESL